MKTFTVTGMTYSYSLKAWVVTELDRLTRSKTVEAEDATAAAFAAVGHEAIESVNGVHIYATGARYQVKEITA